jgi:hypothetical protein
LSSLRALSPSALNNGQIAQYSLSSTELFGESLADRSLESSAFTPGLDRLQHSLATSNLIDSITLLVFVVKVRREVPTV